MHIALATHHARAWGGVERHARDLALSLTARGHRVTLWHEAPGVDAAWAAPFAAVERLGDLAPAEAVARLAQASPDVVYVHKWEDPVVLAAIHAALPVALMVHDHDLTCPRRHRYTLVGRRPCHRPMGLACAACLPFLETVPGARTPGWRPLGPRIAWLRLLRRVRHVVVASPAMRDELALNGVRPERVTVLPPVPADAVPDEPAPPPVAPALLFVGQVVRTKGWDLLLDAWKRLADPPPLTFVGAGNDLPELRRAATAAPHAARLEVAGGLPASEVAARYAAASIVVVPSRWQEPFGLVGLEAMAWARPVVAFATGGIPSWLDDGRTGLLVPPGDVAGLAAALRALIEDPARAAAMGREGHRQRRCRFDAAAATASVEALLRLAAATRPLELSS